MYDDYYYYEEQRKAQANQMQHWQEHLQQVFVEE